MKGATANPAVNVNTLLSVSIHAPNEGSDKAMPIYWVICKAFQSTLPMKGATRRRRSVPHHRGFQSTLPMKGATSNVEVDEFALLFQSTLPMKGATHRLRRLRPKGVVSIHAPNEGSDKVCCWVLSRGLRFNPRSQ